MTGKAFQPYGDACKITCGIVEYHSEYGNSLQTESQWRLHNNISSISLAGRAPQMENISNFPRPALGYKECY